MNIHEQFMQRALDLAFEGMGHVQPNPMVGCVIVHDNEIIGEGFHQRYGGPHAEVVAVQSVKKTDLLSESSLYVTLEPCAHYGKTPPCVDLIIEKKIKNVFIACQDPFAQVNGKGIEHLKHAGINVTTGILEEEARWLNRRFFTFHLEKRPYVILKWAQSKDGYIDPPRAKNQKGSIAVSSKFSRTLSHKWRTEEQAILIGSNTALVDNPSLTPRLHHGNQPLRVLIDPELSVPKNSNILSDGNKTLVINSRKSFSENHTIYHKIKFSSFFDELFHAMYEMNIQSVIVEGGGYTLQQFINENKWDEARVFTSDKEFISGVKSPDFKFNYYEELDSGEDKLHLYYRSKEK